MWKMKKYWIINLLLLFSAIVGMALVAYSTTIAPGIGGDATIYITSARNFLAGKGLGLIQADGTFRLLPYFPPGYPLALSLLGLTGIDLVLVSRWLNICLFGAIIFLLGRILCKASKGQIWFTLAGSLIFALSPVLIPIYSWSMSEPLALFFGFASLNCLMNAIQKPSDTGLKDDSTEQKGTGSSSVSLHLVLAGVLVGLAVFTRYNAIAFAITGGLFLLLAGKEKAVKKLVRTIVYSVLALLPIIIWLVIDLRLTGTVSSRSMEFPADFGAFLLNFWNDVQQSVLFWFLPDSWIYTPRLPAIVMNSLVPIIFLGLLVWFIIWFVKEKKQPSTTSSTTRLWIPILGIFSLIFILVTLMVKITTYPPITINVRMLSPLYISVGLMVLLLLNETVLWFAKRWWVMGAAGMVLVLAILGYGVHSAHVVKQLHDKGMGYTSLEWQQSDTLQALKALPEDTTLVTNQDMLVLFWTGRTCYPVKEIYINEPYQTFSRFGDGDLSNDPGQNLFRQNEATLVLFDTITEQFADIYGDRTTERVTAFTSGLHLMYSGNDGGIYTYREP
jgi:hypothetical protein